MKHNCYSCDFYADFEGVCCFGDCPYCADCPPNPADHCEFWQDRKEENHENYRDF